MINYLRVMKGAVSGGPPHAIAFPQADPGLPDTTSFKRRISPLSRRHWTKSCT